MGWISAVVDGLGFGAANPNDERYWQPNYPVYLASSGQRVSDSTALQVSCMYAGVRLYAEIVGSLPFRVYRETDGGAGREEERSHELWTLLRRRPNEWQHGQQFREVMMAWACLYQQALAQIVEDRTGRIEALIPIHPQSVEETEQLDNRRLRFRIRRDNGTSYNLTQDEVLRIDGFGFGSFRNESVVLHARDAIGLWLAREKFASMFFAQGANPSIAITYPSGIAEDTYKRAQVALRENLQGLGNSHKALIVQHDAKVTPLTFDARGSQLTEQQEGLIAEMARWMDLPPHMLGATTTTTYASVEQFAREFVQFRLGPKIKRIEQSIERDLIDEDDVFVKINTDALLRGSLLERYQAHSIGLQNAFLTRNEVRGIEDMNPIEGGDDVTPAENLFGPDSSEPAVPRPVEDEEQAAVEVPRRLATIARRASERLYAQECRAIASEAAKHAGDAGAFSAGVEAFYVKFGGRVAETLDLEPSAVREYVDRQRSRVVADGVGALEESTVDELCRLALEGTPCQI